jgi:hypothetical protein
LILAEVDDVVLAIVVDAYIMAVKFYINFSKLEGWDFNDLLNNDWAIQFCQLKQTSKCI